MSESSLTILCITAISIAFIHTLIGPDHYLPFIVMSKARNWSLKKTLSLTFACGLGHVLSSVVLGLIGVAIGIGLSKLEAFESMRGSFAAQAMMIFGFSYCVWGLFRALKNRSHTLLLPDEKGEAHEAHDAHNEHKKGSLTAWALFIIFVLGPCEPLIPILMYPAAEHSLFGTILVATLFSVVTILTMMSVVLVSIWGVRFIKISKLERFSHALAGGTILLSGMAIQLLGL